MSSRHAARERAATRGQRSLLLGAPKERTLPVNPKPSEATMGDKSPKSKKRDQAQKASAKARSKAKQEKRQQARTSQVAAALKK